MKASTCSYINIFTSYFFSTCSSYFQTSTSSTCEEKDAGGNHLKYGGKGHIASQRPRQLNIILSNDDCEYNGPVDEEIKIETRDVEKDPVDATIKGDAK